MYNSITENEALDHFRNLGAFFVDRLKIHASRLPVTNNDVAFLAALPELKQLVLTETQITDECMSLIGRLCKLSMLDLSNTCISDNGAFQLATLVKLEALGIYGTQITDATVEIIAKLPKLKMLNISFTAITDAGLFKLARLGCRTIEVHHSRITKSGVHAFTKLCPMTMLVTDDGLVGGASN
jgi:Leucine-rich repeat (LRR) protein